MRTRSTSTSSRRASRPDAGRFEALAAPCEARLRAALATWWEDTAVGGIDSLAASSGAGSGPVHAGVAREAMLASLQGRLGPIGPLDHDALAGAFATWWDASRHDIASVLHNGYVGLVDEWLQSVRGLVEPVTGPTRPGPRRPSAADRRAASEHPLVRALAPELTAGAHDIDDTVRERRDLGARHGERVLVLGVLRDRFQDEIDDRLRLRLVQLHDRYRLWEEKYAVSLAEVQAASDAAGARLRQQLVEMGYTDY